MSWRDRIKRALAGDADAAAPPAPAPDGNPAPHADILRELSAFVVARSDEPLAPEALDPAEHLYDAGYVDSQSSVELLAFVEERFGVRISEVDLVGRLSTLDALARHLNETR